MRETQEGLEGRADGTLEALDDGRIPVFSL